MPIEWVSSFSDSNEIRKWRKYFKCVENQRLGEASFCLTHPSVSITEALHGIVFSCRFAMKVFQLLTLTESSHRKPKNLHTLRWFRDFPLSLHSTRWKTMILTYLKEREKQKCLRTFIAQRFSGWQLLLMPVAFVFLKPF